MEYENFAKYEEKYQLEYMGTKNRDEEIKKEIDKLAPSSVPIGPRNIQRKNRHRINCNGKGIQYRRINKGY